MRKLVLVRHSLPEINPTVPASRWHLSKVGRHRCEPLAERLMNYDLRALASSVEPKAVETAEIVGDLLGLTPNVVEGLHEHERDQVGFLPRADFEEKISDFFRSPQELVFGSETADQAHTRFSGALRNVVETQIAGNMAMITHGTVISLFISRSTGIDAISFWKRMKLPAFVVLLLPELRLLDVYEEISAQKKD